MRIDRTAAALLVVIASAARADGPAAIAWPAGPMEVRVAFAVAREPGFAADLVGREIPFAPIGEPGKRLGALKIAGARLEDGGRTLVLATDPHPFDAAYDLPMDDPSRRGAKLGYTLAGVEATFEPAEGVGWTTWLPGTDLPPKGGLTDVSISHARQLRETSKRGRLTLRGILWSREGLGRGLIEISGQKGTFEATLGGKLSTYSVGADGLLAARLATEADSEPPELVVTVMTGVGGKTPTLGGVNRLTLGWAPSPLPASSTPPAPPFELAGGDPGKGEAVFRSEVAKCASCHQVGGKGGLVGPALDSQAGKDLAAIYQSIAEPSAAIHPDYVPYTVALKGGKVAVGVVRAEGADKLKIADINAQTTVYDKSEVEELRPSATSIMPVGLAGAIGEAGMRDLLAYLSRKP